MARVTRVVRIDLGEAFEQEGPEVCAAARDVFPTIPGVRSFWAGTGAGAVDLVFLVGFDSLEDVEAYRVHPIHVAFVQDELRRRGAAVDARNFVA